MFVRLLSKELQAKAIAELNEEPSRVEDDIEYIKEWQRKERHLNPRMDDQFILSYLRGCKFSLEKTKTKLDNYYTFKGMLPEFFQNRDPFCKEIQELLKTGVILPIMKTETPDSPRIILNRAALMDPSVIKMEYLFQLNMMIAQILINEDDQCIIGGMVMLQDGTGMNLSFMTHMTPSLMKKASMFFQDALPNRPKAMHVFNPPSFFEALFNMMKPFLKEKMLNRFKIHNTDKIEEMYKYVPRSVLPQEYGGDNGSIQDIIDYWKQKVESYAEWFNEDAKYVSDESKRIGKPKTSNDLFGIEGSFRKLNVD